MWLVLNFKIAHWVSQTLGILFQFSNKNVWTSCSPCGYHICPVQMIFSKLLVPSWPLTQPTRHISFKSSSLSGKPLHTKGVSYPLGQWHSVTSKELAKPQSLWDSHTVSEQQFAEVMSLNKLQWNWPLTRFGVLSAVLLKLQIFWEVLLCRWTIGCWRFEGW